MFLILRGKGEKGLIFEYEGLFVQRNPRWSVEEDNRRAAKKEGKFEYC